MDEFGVYKKGDFRFFIPTATYIQMDREIDEMPLKTQLDRMRKVFCTEHAYDIESIYFGSNNRYVFRTDITLRVAITDWLLDMFLYRATKCPKASLNLAMYDKTTKNGFQYYMEAVQWATITAWNILTDHRDIPEGVYAGAWEGDEYAPIPADELIEMHWRDVKEEGIEFKDVPLYCDYPLYWLAEELWKRSDEDRPEIARREPTEYKCWAPKFLVYAYETGINTAAAYQLLRDADIALHNDTRVVLDLETKNRLVYVGDLQDLSWVQRQLEEELGYRSLLFKDYLNK